MPLHTNIFIQQLLWLKMLLFMKHTLYIVKVAWCKVSEVAGLLAHPEMIYMYWPPWLCPISQSAQEG